MTILLTVEYSEEEREYSMKQVDSLTPSQKTYANIFTDFVLRAQKYVAIKP